MQTLDMITILVIASVAIGTYTLRVSGLLLSSRFLGNKRVKIFLEHLPATLLLALVVPSFIKEGLTGLVVVIAIIFCMYKTKNILLSMILGMAIVALSRNFF